MRDNEEPIVYLTIPVPNYYPMPRGNQVDRRATLRTTYHVRIHNKDDLFLRRWCRKNGISLSFFVREVVSSCVEKLRKLEEGEQ